MTCASCVCSACSYVRRLPLGTSDNGRVTHQVPLDERLRAAIRGPSAPGADRVQSALSPKEIQARLRAGDTPEAVAKAAGVPVARVLPYAAPVEAERQRIVDDARAAPVTPPRGPSSPVRSGEAVDARLAEVSGLKPDSVEWSARRRPDGAWVVSLSYAARGGAPFSRPALAAGRARAHRRRSLGQPARRRRHRLKRGRRPGGADRALPDGRRLLPASRPASGRRRSARRSRHGGQGDGDAKPAAKRAAKPARPTRVAAQPAREVESPPVDDQQRVRAGPDCRRSSRRGARAGAVVVGRPAGGRAATRRRGSAAGQRAAPTHPLTVS